MYTIKLLVSSLFILSSFLFSNCVDETDACLSLDGGNLNYNSSVDIAGFQFDHDGCVTGATGGGVAANGFTISATSIEVSIPEDGYLNVSMVDLNGRVIDTIYDGFIGSGYYIKNWDAVEFSSGIYIVQMSINGFYDTQKVILIK